jgi:hypothetical protein
LYRQLFYEVCQRRIEDGLTEKKNIGFRSIYTSAVVDKFTENILRTLDQGMYVCVFQGLPNQTKWAKFSSYID